jgi:hypothetical protein
MTGKFVKGAWIENPKNSEFDENTIVDLIKLLRHAMENIVEDITSIERKLNTLEKRIDIIANQPKQGLISRLIGRS